jgi:CRISPR-associated protein Cmr5
MLKQERITKLVYKAIKAIKAVKRQKKQKNSKKLKVFRIVKKDSNSIPKKVHKGYIDGLGANIIQSGLVPTILFYMNESGKKAKSSLWLDAIYYMIKGKDEYEKIDKKKNNILLAYVINQTTKSSNKLSIQDLDTNKLQELEDEILEIVSALKLAFRTFKIPQN